MLLLVASYFFYACWDWKFLLLILFSTLFNYSIAQFIAKAHSRKKLILWVGILVNLGLLGYFKYFNFFIESFVSLFKVFGTVMNLHTLQIILPVGISFYTFQGISYIVDVYRQKNVPSHDLMNFSLFITFFPQLVAGPIERTEELLPQIAAKRTFNYDTAVDGMRMIVLGLFEKMVIADNCAQIVDQVYQNYTTESGSTLFFAAVLFSFQIYGDFCGYTHIAIGCAKLLGFDLTKNFNYPYLAKNIADFWRRWHISFSNWLRDYIYFPLGGSKKGNFIQMRNLTIVFVISGIWHGADATFVIYGFIHALLYILYIYYRKWTKNIPSSSSALLNNLYDWIAIGSTFIILTIARVFFRAENYSEAMLYFKTMFTESLFTKPAISKTLILCMFIFLFFEWLQRHKDHLLDLSSIKSKTVRYSIYFAVIFMVFYAAGETQKFIYFQF
ncbi:MBOAT family O-acyltransferase [Flavobacterium sp. '19STA2R22 D10 B1']|uniref:MBOAT family O-acyltransferase n=1 Tax=Flavobacterium aerium TaxID=3037261 RepID=UPI00278C10C2|nr:MBOAT family O-acyltransferase [Flavobacterium sp. '19STA2R22 D10 B1']